MFLAVRAYQELLLNIVAMVSSKDEKIRTSGMVLRSDVFYEAEYREVCIQQLSLYQPEKMSLRWGIFGFFSSRSLKMREKYT